jgi:outer membrane lipoprotein-sorting protein
MLSAASPQHWAQCPDFSFKETAVLRPVTRISALLLMFFASFAFSQSEFSAEIVNDKQSDANHAKIYFGKDKMRVESLERAGKGSGAFIMNMATHTSTVLMDEQHMYMEMPEQMANRQHTYDFFRVHDVDNACSDWLAQERSKGGSCHKVGTESVNGRNTVKYEGTNARGEAGTVWIDPKLQFPVKWQGKDGGGELRNIQEGSQPASLFEVPTGYTKFDMGSMRQRR